VTEFPIPTTGAGPWAIAAGSDGSMWFSEESADQIGRITPTGTVTGISDPDPELPSGTNRRGTRWEPVVLGDVRQPDRPAASPGDSLDSAAERSPSPVYGAGLLNVVGFCA
jgi:hypothetical protein